MAELFLAFFGGFVVIITLFALVGRHVTKLFDRAQHNDGDKEDIPEWVENSINDAN